MISQDGLPQGSVNVLRLGDGLFMVQGRSESFFASHGGLPTRSGGGGTIQVENRGFWDKSDLRNSTRQEICVSSFICCSLPTPSDDPKT